MIYYHTGGEIMATTKIAITLDEKTLKHLDRLVKERLFPNRSKAIQDAVEEKLKRLERNRLARECAKLDPSFEKEMAEEGMDEELKQWPEY
jgi:Arc/MetJ-type ribon-helix-helix transcriptional regulator